MNYKRMKMRYNKDAEKNLDFRAKACRTPKKTAKEFRGLSAMIQAGWPETKQQVPHSI